jgi:hypothetical protein
VIFDKEKRDNPLDKFKATIPGPGQYLIPVSFYNVPKYLVKDNKTSFRFV